MVVWVDSFRSVARDQLTSLFLQSGKAEDHGPVDQGCSPGRSGSRKKQIKDLGAKAHSQQSNFVSSDLTF